MAWSGVRFGKLREYAASPAHGRFLTGELVPLLERRLPLRGSPQGRLLAGASFGAVAALSAAVRAPGFYGGVLLESASLRYTLIGRDLAAGQVFEPVVRFANQLRARPRVVTERIFQTFGSYEPLAEPNRAYALYLARGEKPAPGEVVVSLELPDGRYRAEWVNPLTGKIDKRETVKSSNGLVILTSPPYREDIALKLTKK